VLPTKQPCTVLPAHQCVGELSFAKKGSELCYLPKSISRLRSLRSHVLIIQPRASQRPRCTALRASRNWTNHTGRWGPVHGRAVSDP
jgi:hypothetical protein